MTSSRRPLHRSPVGPRPPLLRPLQPRTRFRPPLILRPTLTAGPRTAGDRNEQWLHLTPPIQRNIGLRARSPPTIPRDRTILTLWPAPKKMNHHRGIGDLDPQAVIIRASTGPPPETDIDTQNDISGVASSLSWGWISVVKWKRKVACECKDMKRREEYCKE